MDSKQFNMLAIAAVVSLVTAGIVHSAYDTWTVENQAGERLLPQLDSTAGQIAQVRVQKGETTFTFDKAKDGEWTFAERGGYPVEGVKVRELISKVARAELVQAKTRDPKRYDLLELGDPAKKDTTATLVQLNDAKGKPLGELVVGKRRASAFGQGKSGSYLRKPDDPQTWLANLVIRIPLDVSDWVKPVFFRLPLSDVKSVELLPSDGDAVAIVREEATAKPDAKSDKKGEAPAADKLPTFKFVAIPDGQQPKSGIDPTVMVKALETLELTDVRKAKGAEVPKNATKIAANVETTTGMKLEATVLKIGADDRWVTIDVREEGSDKKSAAALKKAVEGWQFKIADWRSRQIFKTRAEMFEKKEPEAEPDNKAGNAPGQGLLPPAGLSLKPKP